MATNKREHFTICGGLVIKLKNIGFRYIQKSLKINIQMKPKVFLLGLMDREVESSYGVLFLYMITAAKLHHTQNWKT